jgi:biotin-(acetyl-CoA carboxylase) ligase
MSVTTSRFQDEFETLYYDELDSTNEEARRCLLSGGLKTPLIIRAGSQSAGRGSQGRRWASPPGVGLYFSIVHPQPGVLSLLPPNAIFQSPSFSPSLPAGEPTILNPDWALCTRAAGLACAQVLREETGLQIQLKPINDLYLEGRKLGGILCESIFGEDQDRTLRTSLSAIDRLPTCRGLITGIGVNLRQSDAVEIFCRTEQRPMGERAASPVSEVTLWPKDDNGDKVEEMYTGFSSSIKGSNQPISLQECLPIALFTQWLDKRDGLIQDQLVLAFAERVNALYQRLFWEVGYGKILLVETAAIEFLVSKAD